MRRNRAINTAYVIVVRTAEDKVAIVYMVGYLSYIIIRSIGLVTLIKERALINPKCGSVPDGQQHSKTF